MAIRLYRRVLATSPAPFRAIYAHEAAGALAQLLRDERASRGVWAAHRTWLRAMADAARTVRRERASVARTGGRGVFTGFLDDVRYLWRSWRRAKAFACTAILTVAIGLGLNAGIFAFADGFLFRPLPFDKPDDLFLLGESHTVTGGLPLDDFDAVQRGMPGISGVAEWNASVVGQFERGDRWRSLSGFSVSPGFEDVLGFRLLVGRPFRSDEFRALPVLPCWLGYEFWLDTFGGQASALGQHLRIVTQTLRGEKLSEFEVVGVMPQAISSFDLNNRPPDIVTPAIPVDYGPRRQFISAFPMVRLAPGVTPEVARQRLQAVVDAVQGPSSSSERRTIRLQPLRDVQVRGGRPTAWLLFTVSLAILLLVIVNLSQLLLARAVTRSGEIAVRLALGASRWRVARLLLTESLTVAAIGLALGIELGWALSRVLHATVPQYATGNRNMALVPMSFNHRVGIYTAMLAGVTALAAGVIPAFSRSSATAGHLWRALVGLRESLSGRAARAMLTVEIALVTVILAGTALVGTSAWRFLHQPLGFDPSSREALYVSMAPPAPGERGPDPSMVRARRENLRATIRAVPGVADFAVASDRSMSRVVVDGHSIAPDVASATRVDAGYFDVLGVQLLKGRAFTSVEADSNAPVAVIDARLASRVWPGQDPIGKVIADGSGSSRTIIGVVPHLRWRLAIDTPETLYVPLDATGTALDGIVNMPGTSLRRAQDAITRAAVSVVGDGRISVSALSAGITSRDEGEYRFQGPIVTAMGAVAFLLGAIGVYGLVTYLVEQRIREFGIRLALGANRSELWWAVFRLTLAPAVVAVVIGLVVSLWTNRFLASLLFSVKPTSPGVLAVVAAGLLSAAAAAAIRPARRVLRIDPVKVLRAE